jgi:8-oxo-dGTP pyrophosphatase MutT (NUDIX family)
MDRKRAQCIAIREDKVLMVKHVVDGNEWWALPGGGIEKDESFRDAVIREMREECNVDVSNVKKLSALYDMGLKVVTYLVDIGEQEPILGLDPELRERSLVDIGWFRLNEISERDRAFLWWSGLMSVDMFREEVLSWGDEISIPQRKDSEK